MRFALSQLEGGMNASGLEIANEMPDTPMPSNSKVNSRSMNDNIYNNVYIYIFDLICHFISIYVQRHRM